MKKIFLSIILLLLILPVFSQNQPAGLKRFAIFAGSNDGGSERIQLEYAETDALAMYDVFTEIGGLSSSNTIIVKDPKPEEIISAFEKMKVIIEKERNNMRRTEFFFYYSGHSDDTGILPGGELFDYSVLREKINSMNTDVKVVVLDSCSSGSFTRLKGGIKRASFLVDESVDTKGHAYLTSSSENEAAQESDMIEGSYFTHYLISALRGAADNTGDGTVTLNEAYSFAADETLARTTSSIAGAQHPSYSINLTGSGDLVLTDLREVTSSINIDKSIDGRIFFRDDSDRLVIEFRKRAGIPISLSLPGGVYKIDLETEMGLTTSIVTIQSGEVSLNMSNFTPVERSFARSRGESAESETKTIGEKIDTTLDTVEESLENKMKEIRSIINEKFSIPSNEESVLSEVEEETDVDLELERTDLEHEVFGFSPILSNYSSNKVRNISLNFIGKPYAINGLSIGFMNMTYQDVHGVQLGALSNQTGRDQYGLLASGLFNIVERDQWGLSTSGIFNIAEGSVNGVQSSGIFNISSHELTGVQNAGIFNISSGTVLGVQTGGIFNVAEGPLYGLQAAGIFNLSTGTVTGIQVSGIFNVAEGPLYGLQAAGILNRAEDVQGVQCGLINVGKQVHGMQIGLININNDINGLPIGLLTISKTGIMDLGGWYESSGFIYTGVQSGTRHFYNFFYTALPVENQGSVIVTGFGIGGRINLGSLYIDVDSSIKNVTQSIYSSQNDSLFPNLRLSAGLKLFGFMSVFGGLSMDVHIPDFTRKSKFFHNSSEPWIIKDTKTDINAVEIHPKWFAGLKISFN